MRVKLLVLSLAACAAALITVPEAAAQIFTPTYLAPQQHSGVGAFISGGTGGGDGFAVEGIARRSFGSFDLGARAGVGDVDGTSLLLGLEYRNPLYVADVPFDVAVTGAAQAIIGDHGGPAVSAGITGGRSFPLQNVIITPYVHPRAALTDNDDDDSSLDLALLVELGAEFAFVSNFNFHLALGFGNETANLGFGVSWP